MESGASGDDPNIRGGSYHRSSARRDPVHAGNDRLRHRPDIAHKLTCHMREVVDLSRIHLEQLGDDVVHITP
jgi:hypothetical protein